MATHLAAGEHKLKPSVSRPVQTEAFVESQLARARVRIRLIDLGAALLGFLILTLSYAFVMALLDRWLDLSATARKTSFVLYGVGAVLYAVFLIARPMIRRVNPYYAASQLEKTLPEAKNSVINWLDLHHQSMSPAFRTAIDLRAAEDLADVDLDSAISNRRASWLGGGAGGLFFALLIFYLLSPRQFLSLMNRAFSPFESSAIATRTQLTILKPDTGEATVPVGHAVSFLVYVDGRVPSPNSTDALKLLYRYNPNEPYEERLFDSTTANREWVTTLLPTEVRTGFWYKVAGGDAETPEFRVQVRSRPLLIGFDVSYKHRPYLDYPDRISKDPNLDAIRGTKISLVARTNRIVREGELVIRDPKLKTDRKDPNGNVKGEKIEGDPQALRFIFELDMKEDSDYRIHFLSADNEKNEDPLPYRINVLLDRPPQVQLRKPGQDVDLPLNGILNLEGSASDDYGLGRLALHMKLVDGQEIQERPYRAGKDLRQGDGSYPLMLDYKDYVELDKLKNKAGAAIKPRPGDVLEYWLEAADNCDYPSPNIGSSKIYRVRLGEPAANKKEQQQKKEQANQKQQEHEQQQDKQLSEQKRPDSNPEKGNDAKQSPDPKNEGDGKEPNKGAQGASKGQEKAPAQDPGKTNEQENTEQRLKQVQDELNKQEQDKQSKHDQGKPNDKPQDGQGTSKEQQPAGAEKTQGQKDGADPKDKANPQPGTEKTGSPKDGSKENGNQQAGTDKAQGQKDGADTQGQGQCSARLREVRLAQGRI